MSERGPPSAAAIIARERPAVRPANVDASTRTVLASPTAASEAPYHPAAWRGSESRARLVHERHEPPRSCGGKAGVAGRLAAVDVGDLAPRRPHLPDRARTACRWPRRGGEALPVPCGGRGRRTAGDGRRRRSGPGGARRRGGRPGSRACRRRPGLGRPRVCPRAHASMCRYALRLAPGQSRSPRRRSSGRSATGRRSGRGRPSLRRVARSATRSGRQSSSRGVTTIAFSRPERCAAGSRPAISLRAAVQRRGPRPGARCPRCCRSLRHSVV
jgi:hypothetical protein